MTTHKKLPNCNIRLLPFGPDVPPKQRTRVINALIAGGIEDADVLCRTFARAYPNEDVGAKGGQTLRHIPGIASKGIKAITEALATMGRRLGDNMEEVSELDERVWFNAEPDVKEWLGTVQGDKQSEIINATIRIAITNKI